MKYVYFELRDVVTGSPAASIRSGNEIQEYGAAIMVNV